MDINKTHRDTRPMSSVCIVGTAISATSYRGRRLSFFHATKSRGGKMIFKMAAPMIRCSRRWDRYLLVADSQQIQRIR